MKKLLLLVFISALISLTTYAQNSLSLSWTGGAITNGQLITISGDTAGTVYCYLDCKNNNASTLTVKVRKKYVDIVPGSENSFCWGTCYTATTMVSTYSVNIAKDSTSHDFSGDYKAKGNLGISTVMYTFFDVNNTNDSICVQVAYDCLSSSVPENKDSYKISFSNAYPNPARNYTTFTYDLSSSSANATLVIRDMVGNIVHRMPITDESGSLRLETESLSDGVYFYSLMLNETPYLTKKLVIKH